MRIHGRCPGGQRPRTFNRKKGEVRLVAVQTSAGPSTTTRPLGAELHREAPFRTTHLYYSLWYYSLHRSTIALRMQRSRSRRSAPQTAEELFGRVLREARKAEGLSQEELAHRSGYHPTYIGQLERGKKSPSLRTIVSLAGVLGLSASEMLRRVEVLPVNAR